MNGVIRDMMDYHASFFEAPETKVREAVEWIRFLATTMPAENNPYGLFLQREVEALQQQADHYLFHEYLEEYNDPLYFHQFMQQAALHGLQYLGEADFSSMSVSHFGPTMEERLRSMSSDTVRMEQYIDFVRNRTFRQTLLCRADVGLDRALSPQRLLDLFLATKAEAASGDEVDLHAHHTVQFERSGSTLTTSAPLVKAAMVHLRRIWPASLAFGDLLAESRRMVTPTPTIMTASREEADRMQLAEPLLQCYALGLIDLHIERDRFTTAAPERPVASRLARFQAHSGSNVTSFRHEVIVITDLQRQLLQLMDGTHDGAALAEVAHTAVRTGELVVQEEGRPVSDRSRSRDIVESLVEDNLRQLAASALIHV